MSAYGCQRKCLFCAYTWHRRHIGGLQNEAGAGDCLWAGSAEKTIFELDLAHPDTWGLPKLRIVGLDGFSERLRRMVNKPITRDMLRGFFRRLAAAKVAPNHMKVCNIVGYGTFPDRKRLYFTLRDATHTLAATFRGAGREGAVQAGLEKLAAELLARQWARTDGASLQVERLLIDSGYLPAVCNAVPVKVGPAVLLSKGTGLKAGNKPMASYTRRPGERHGCNWYIPNASRSSEFRHACPGVACGEAGSPSTQIHGRPSSTPRLRRPPGDRGALTLFGKKPEQHRLFAEHPGGPGFDCLVPGAPGPPRPCPASRPPAKSRPAATASGSGTLTKICGGRTRGRICETAKP